MEDRAGGQRGLMMTAMTLIEPTRQLAVGLVGAFRADEAPRPAMPKECLSALAFGAVLLKEGPQ